MDTLRSSHISVRFKYGIHTIYHFVDTLAPVEELSKELLDILRERYPDGLTVSSNNPGDKTLVPDENDELEMKYAVLKVANDPTQGWKCLNIRDGSISAGSAGMTPNGIVAFAFVNSENEDPDFEVEWPSYDDEGMEMEE